MYCYAVVNSAVGASKNHLGMFNATGSGRVIRVWRVEVVPHLTAAVVGLSTTFSLFRTTTTGTQSTAAILRKTDPLDANLPAQVTGSAAYSAQPTVTADSQLATLTVNNEETAALGAKSPLWEAVPSRGIEPVIVRENGGLVVQQSAMVGAGAFSVFIYFTADTM